VVQNPTRSVEDDVAAVRMAIAAQDGPAVLVAHSYGGVVMTEAGTDPNVAGLVHIAAFAADVDPEHAAFMAASQVPWGVEALRGEVTEPAWRSRPSGWLIATDDLIIPPDAPDLIQTAVAELMSTA
jgi:pimeloyl-ACP methyl ester carboxylesterase